MTTTQERADEEIILKLLNSRVDRHFLSQLPPDFNWLLLGFAAKSRALGSDEINIEQRINAAVLAHLAWNHFVKNGGERTAVDLPELLLRVGIYREFGNLSEEFSDDRLFDFIHLKICSIIDSSPESLRPYMGENILELDRGILLRLRRIKNYLNTAEPYLNDVIADCSKEIQWWYKRRDQLP